MIYTVTIEPFEVQAEGATESESHANALYAAWDRMRNGQYAMTVEAVEEVVGAAI